MTKWEYQIVDYTMEMTNSELNQNLDEAGNEGWEAVCALPNPSLASKTQLLRLLMKRQKR